MNLSNLKCLLLGVMLTLILVFGSFVFFSFQRMLQKIQVQTTNQGLFVKF